MPQTLETSTVTDPGFEPRRAETLRATHYDVLVDEDVAGVARDEPTRHSR